MTPEKTSANTKNGNLLKLIIIIATASSGTVFTMVNSRVGDVCKKVETIKSDTIPKLTERVTSLESRQGSFEEFMREFRQEVRQELKEIKKSVQR